MNTYVIKRFMLFIPTLLLVTLMVFALMRLVPGDPAELLLMGFEGDGQFSEKQLADLRAKLGTDRPLAIQYLDWIWGMVRGDFGTSMYFDTPISEDLAAKLPITLELSALALLLAFAVAVPLGVLSAVRQDTIADYASRIIAIAGVAMPTFWIGILVVYFLVTWFDWLPPLGYANLWSDPWTNLQQMFFPAVALGFYNMALVARVTRSSMLEVFRGGLHPHRAVQGPARAGGDHPTRAEKRVPADPDHIGLAGGSADSRHRGHRDDLPGARDGSPAGGQHPAPGLHHDPEHRDGHRVHGSRLEPGRRPSLCLAGPTDTLRVNAFALQIFFANAEPH